MIGEKVHARFLKFAPTGTWWNRNFTDRMRIMMLVLRRANENVERTWFCNFFFFEKTNLKIDKLFLRGNFNEPVVFEFFSKNFKHSTEVEPSLTNERMRSAGRLSVMVEVRKCWINKKQNTFFVENVRWIEFRIFYRVWRSQCCAYQIWSDVLIRLDFIFH